MMTICSVYRSSKKEGMYLYVEKSACFNKVPKALLDMFGEPVLAMTLLLKPDLKLANIDCGELKERLRVEGYHLQMPPKDDDTENNLNELVPQT